MDVEVIILMMESQLMNLQIYSTLKDIIKEAYPEDPKLHKLREQLEAELRSDLCIYEDGSLHFSNCLRVASGDI